MKKFTKILLISILSAATITALGACKKKKPTTPTTHQVNFYVNGVSVYSEEVKKGASYEKGYAITDIDGYDFSGWHTDDALTTDAAFPVKVTDDVNFYGEWVEEKYTLTFKDGETVLGSEAHYKAAYLLAPASPEKAGYRFNGWYTDAACTKLFDYIEDQMPAHDVTLYAGWTPLYAVNYDVQGGSAIASDYYAIGDEVKEPTAPTRDGYVFTGWYLDAAGKYPCSFGGVKADETDVTIYAGWRARNLNVTVTYVNGETTLKTFTAQKEGDAFPAYDGSALTKEYFVFDGWYLNEQCTIPVVYEGENQSLIGNENTTVYAGWHLAEKYATVSLVIGDETQSVYLEKGETFSAEMENFTVAVPTGTIIGGYIDQNGEIYDENSMILNDFSLIVSFYTNGLKFEQTDGGYNVVGFDATSTGALYLPDLYAGEPVLAIADSAFAGDGFTSVSIGSFVSSIGASAFSDCTALANVTFRGNELQTVGANAFAGTAYTSALASENYVVLGGRVLYSVNASFTGELTLGETVVGIADGAAYGVAGLSKVTAPGVVSVGVSAFQNCAALTNFKGANRMTAIGANAFSGCAALAEISLTGLTAIANETFSGCTTLQKVVIPASVKTIGDGAFENCSGLKKVEIGSVLQGSSLTAMGSEAFGGCTNLTVIVAYGNVFTIGADCMPVSATLYVKANLVDAYKAAFTAYADKIDSVENIPVEG